MTLLISSTNKVSTAKDILPVILYFKILWSCSKGRSYKLSRSSKPLDITQVPLGGLGIFWILAISSGCMVSHLHEDTGIWLSWGITPSIHGLQTQGYEIVCYHWICVLRLNLICYLLLCLVLRPDQNKEIIPNPVNGKYHPVLEVLKRRKKSRILAFGPNL